MVRQYTCSVGFSPRSLRPRQAYPALGLRSWSIVLSDWRGALRDTAQTAKGGVWDRKPGYHVRNVASHSPFTRACESAAGDAPHACSTASVVFSPSAY